jgi:hypothetical protein
VRSAILELTWDILFKYFHLHVAIFSYYKYQTLCTHCFSLLAKTSMDMYIFQKGRKLHDISVCGFFFFLHRHARDLPLIFTFFLFAVHTTRPGKATCSPYFAIAGCTVRLLLVAVQCTGSLVRPGRQQEYKTLLLCSTARPR